MTLLITFTVLVGVSNLTRPPAPRFQIGPSCPGKMVWTPMEPPLAMPKTVLPSDWYACLRQSTAGANGDTIDEHVRWALERCGTTLPDGTKATPGRGLFAGHSCASARANRVHYFVQVDGKRALGWAGWHQWQCD